MIGPKLRPWTLEVVVGTLSSLTVAMGTPAKWGNGSRESRGTRTDRSSRSGLSGVVPDVSLLVELRLLLRQNERAPPHAGLPERS